jgi:hypothetical protein
MAVADGVKVIGMTRGGCMLSPHHTPRFTLSRPFDAAEHRDQSRLGVSVPAEMRYPEVCDEFGKDMDATGKCASIHKFYFAISHLADA